jgi:hypothetical protein
MVFFCCAAFKGIFADKALEINNSGVAVFGFIFFVLFSKGF